MTVAYSGGRSVPRADLDSEFREWMAEVDFFAATKCLGISRTNKLTAKFPMAKAASMLRPGNVDRAVGGGYSRSVIELSDESFACVERGHEFIVDDLKRKELDDVQLDQLAMIHAGLKVLIDMEIDVAAKIQGNTYWPTSDSSLYTDKSSEPWDTPTSPVINHISEAMEKVRRKCGRRADTLIVAESQFQNIKNNDDVLLRFPGAPVITDEMLIANLAAVLGLRKIIRCGMVKNTAALGVTESLEDIWNDDYALVCITAPDDAPEMTPCIGRTFLFVPDSPELVTFDQYRSDDVRGYITRGRHVVDERPFAPRFGHRIKID